MHLSAKPVRKCHGCGLNFDDHCGVFESPHLIWERHSICPGYKNEKMLADYMAAEAKKRADLRKEKRRETARSRSTVMHQAGDQHVLMAAARR